MIKRTIEISRHPAHLSAKLEQLVIQPFEADKSAGRSLPAEDVGLVMVDQAQSTFTHHALVTLMRHGAAFVVCGPDHLPLGLMLPMSSHTEVVWRIEAQLGVTKPTRKRLWQQIVCAKVKAQARNLPRNSRARAQLMQLATEVKSGDPTNIEGQAARLYWAAWLSGVPEDARPGAAQTLEGQADVFHRDTDGADPLNAMLNYGYSVLRAAVGRALVSSGFFPALGLHHQHRSNSFCLADDLMEPLRPMVDARVRQLHRAGYRELIRPVKAELLTILTAPVRTGGHTGPLMVGLSRMTSSLGRCYTRIDQALAIPVPIMPDRDDGN